MEQSRRESQLIQKCPRLLSNPPLGPILIIIGCINWLEFICYSCGICDCQKLNAKFMKSVSIELHTSLAWWNERVKWGSRVSVSLSAQTTGLLLLSPRYRMVHEVDFFTTLHYFWRKELILSSSQTGNLDRQMRDRRGGGSGRKRICVRVSFDHLLAHSIACSDTSEMAKGSRGRFNKVIHS
jgi:hypothetical protein